MMKVILKRIGAIKNKKGKNCCIGMVICKAPQKQMGRKGKIVRLNKEDK